MCCGSQEKREVIITTHSVAVIDLLLTRDYRWNPSQPRSSNPTFLTCAPIWELQHPICSDWKSQGGEDIVTTYVFISTGRRRLNKCKNEETRKLLSRLHIAEHVCSFYPQKSISGYFCHKYIMKLKFCCSSRSKDF